MGILLYFRGDFSGQIIIAQRQAANFATSSNTQVFVKMDFIISQTGTPVLFWSPTT